MAEMLGRSMERRAQSMGKKAADQHQKNPP